MNGLSLTEEDFKDYLSNHLDKTIKYSEYISPYAEYGIGEYNSKREKIKRKREIRLKKLDRILN